VRPDELACTGSSGFRAKESVAKETQYGVPAKIFHWLIVGLLIVQYLIGWLMPDIHRGMQPGTAMMFHVSSGVTILALMSVCFLWRLAHPVTADGSLAPWQRASSAAVHWLLYLLVFAVTVSGWFFASARGWTIRLYGIVDLPMLTAANSALARAIGRWHGELEWMLLAFVALHVLAALVHLLVYRDKVVARMMP
jgi:cytochrome b561